MFDFKTHRSDLVSALMTAERWYGGGRAKAVEDLPALSAPEAREEWLYALGGDPNGPGGLIDDIEREIRHGAEVPRMRAWLRAYDRAVELRAMLLEMPAAAAAEPMKVGCECVSGCALCDGSGLLFAESRAA